MLIPFCPCHTFPYEPFHKGPEDLGLLIVVYILGFDMKKCIWISHNKL